MNTSRTGDKTQALQTIHTTVNGIQEACGSIPHISVFPR